ncbi:maturation protein [ssRNA phage Esthiorhiza.2_3]|uniref:Maturation protein n=2 Tax=Fiersviridae TaxID=2842319 RepID=A0A8S5L188_9VIRU|nr:maturation protein [ssRNA phage Esthiorhiza.2_3]QDH88527.1 MAG: hypothetical protein H1Rhizo27392_000002 [Leviviridae sp.]QDH89975.1 MAG: hypothetical protein H2RhizoL491021e4350_000003 [Leviviridae sp.]DAD51654.1 TPA_asm: maturation protein [ssRNA phage Esthiorhiza.2_3]
MALIKSYPVDLPLDAKKLKAQILSTANLWLTLGWNDGEYFRFSLWRKNGTRAWVSPPYQLSDVPEQLIVQVPQVRAGYRVMLEWSFYQPRRNTVYHYPVKYPFSWEKKKSSPSSPIQPLILIKGQGDDFRRARHQARSRATGPQKGRPPRAWSPKSQRGANVTKFDTGHDVGYERGALSYDRTVQYMTYQRTQSGTITPGYTARKKSGTLPVNDYSMTMTTIKDGGRIEQTWFTTNPNEYSVQYGPYSAALGGDYGNLDLSSAANTTVDNKAVRKLIDRAGQDVNNIAQDLVQYSQTINMITDISKRIASAASNSARGNFVGAARDLWQSRPPVYRKGHEPKAGKSAANNWLAYQYGWKPLLQDIHGIMESFAKLNKSDRTVQVARSSASGELSTSDDLIMNTAGSPHIGKTYKLIQWNTRYGIRYRVDNHMSAFLNQTGFTNPLNLAWEVLPYSFVVDWFLPIGPWLEAMTAWNGLTFLSGWRSKLTRVTTYNGVSYDGQRYPFFPTDSTMCNMHGSIFAERITYTRTKLTSFPSQEIPKFKNPLGVEHALNAVALVRSAFRK